MALIYAVSAPRRLGQEDQRLRKEDGTQGQHLHLAYTMSGC
ncbi:hypothetical protein LEMLEM_LOCUS11280 [Lemmus lemmus]